MDFARYVESFQTLYLNAKKGSEPALAPLSSLISFIPKKILILAPHPDDECLMTGFAIRAQEEFGAEVGVVPFSYGSKKERRAERKQELQAALTILGFSFIDPRGTAPVTSAKPLATGTDDELTADEFLRALMTFKPDVVITTHLKDGHPVHMKSADLAKRMLQQYAQTSGSTIQLLQSEFWQSMERPNLLVPLSVKSLSKMGEALMAHVGEVSRNPYHLTLPAWAMEQVRRGSEMREAKPGQAASGTAIENAVFGQIYRLETITS